MTDFVEMFRHWNAGRSTQRVSSSASTTASRVTDGEQVDLPDRFAYACSETAPPTAEAIGDLVQEALESARVERGDGCQG